MRSRENTYRTTAGLFVEVGYGYDSNVNGGVGSANINLPVFGNAVIGQAGVKTKSNFNWLAVGGQISHPISPGLAVFAGGQIDGKFNSSGDAQQFDRGNFAANGGVSYFKDKNFYRLTASRAEVTVDYNRFRTVSSLSGPDPDGIHAAHLHDARRPQLQLDHLYELHLLVANSFVHQQSGNTVRAVYWWRLLDRIGGHWHPQWRIHRRGWSGLGHEFWYFGCRCPDSHILSSVYALA